MKRDKLNHVKGAFRVGLASFVAVSVAACGWLLPDGVLEESVDASQPDGTSGDPDALLSSETGADAGSDASDSGNVDVAAGPCTDEPFTALSYVMFGDQPAAGPLTFSRDELQAFYVFNGSMYRRDRTTRTAPFLGEGIVITSGGVDFAMVDVSVSSDGKVLYASGYDGDIYARPLNNGVATGSWQRVMVADAGGKVPASAFSIPFASGSSVWATATPSLGGEMRIVRTTLSGGTYSPLEIVMNGDNSGPLSFFVVAENPAVAFIGYRFPTFVRRAVLDAGGLYSIGAAVSLFDGGSATEVPRWLSPDGCRLYVQRVLAGVVGKEEMYVASRTPKDAGL